MKRSGRAIFVLLILSLAAGCTPRQIKPVATIDPAPLLEKVQARRAAFEKGLSGALDLSFSASKHRYSSKVYIVAYPDGAFRLEVPAPLGGTALAMVSSNGEILAYYPGKGRAFRSSTDGRSLNPYLPFPLPVDSSMLPSLIMGVAPPGSAVTNATAWLLDSGEELLEVTWDDEGLRFTYLFGKHQGNSVKDITIQGHGVKVSLSTLPENHELPADFNIEMQDATIRGHWDSVAPFSGDKAALDLRIPADVPVMDLEAPP